MSSPRKQRNPYKVEGKTFSSFKGVDNEDLGAVLPGPHVSDSQNTFSPVLGQLQARGGSRLDSRFQEGLAITGTAYKEGARIIAAGTKVFAVPRVAVQEVSLV